jgi:ppGpp synthetase/RelA/SpoT-type nucleotidyltranferase
MDVVQQFILNYLNDYERYERTSRLAAEICEKALERNGIRAIVSYRTKKVDRLESKILGKYKNTKYSTLDQLSEDIRDLCGVRIALYFPGDMIKIKDIINRQFSIAEEKIFPQKNKRNNIQNGYPKIFSGYRATHYRVHLLPHHRTLNDIFIEIQIASVLMHAWAEVEHDLIYKPLNGSLSEEEFALLDQINGLVLSGEIALERLQKAMEKRVRHKSTIFGNHFELAAFLYDHFSKINQNCDIDNIDELFLFLQFIGLNSPEKLLPFIKEVSLNTDGNVTHKLLNKIILSDPVYYENYIDFKLKYEKKIQELSDDELKLKIFNMHQIETLFNILLNHVKTVAHLSVAKGESLSEVIEIYFKNENNLLYDYVHHLRKLFEDKNYSASQDETYFESSKSIIDTFFKKYYGELTQESKLLLLAQLKKNKFI